MHWVLINQLTAAIQELHLENQEGLQLTVKYNPLHRSVRVSSQQQHRLFFIESAGSLSGKLRFLNEYGFNSGEATYDRGVSQQGYLILDGKRYNYDLSLHNDQPGCVIRNASGREILATCQIPYSLDRAEQGFDWPSLIFSVCWYLNLPASHKETTYA